MNPRRGPGPSTALLTDRYELTMIRSALADGTADRACVFEVFARRLPRGRRYGVVGGTGRLLERLADFRFTEAEIDAVSEGLDERTVRWLREYRFRGDVDGYPEGELYFPDSPVLRVTGTFADAVVMETLVLSVLNHDSAIAAAATVLRTLPARGGTVSLTAEQAETWLTCLNDVRLGLGEVLLADDPNAAPNADGGAGPRDIPETVDPEDPRAPRLDVYHWLTFMQDSLCSTLMGE